MTGSRLTMLADALRLLAADTEAQLQYLTDLGLPQGVDELALEYDAIAAAAQTMLESGELNEEQADCIQSLNARLESMSGEANAHLWTPQALRSAQQWQDIRILADKCLRLLLPESPRGMRV